MLMDDLRALLRGDAAILAAVGDRVGWGERRQGSSLPAIVMTRGGGGDAYTMRGVVTLRETRVQIDVWGESYRATRILADAVVRVLSGHSGTTGGTRFHAVFLDADRETREASGLSAQNTGTADRFFRVSQDYLVHHSGA